MSKDTLKELYRRFNIKGFQGVSLLEWEGKLTSILFLPECNLRCPFCHSRSLVLQPNKEERVPFERAVDYLNSKKGWVDGVVITGGEPTMHGWLFDLIDEIKKLKILVMIETNGTYPERIKELLSTKRLDYIAMDIKAPLDSKKYKKAAGVDVDIGKIKASIDIIVSSRIDYEFRTTAVPGIIDVTDIIEIAKTIKGAKKLALQQFSNKDTLDPAYLKVKPYPKEVLEDMLAEAQKFIKKVVIRNE